MRGGLSGAASDLMAGALARVLSLSVSGAEAIPLLC